MANRTAVADGQHGEQLEAAKFALVVQDAVNLLAIVNHFREHIVALHAAGVTGDELNNHPMVLLFSSKLESLSRMTTRRLEAAFEACEALAVGQEVTYEVIPIE